MRGAGLGWEGDGCCHFAVSQGSGGWFRGGWSGDRVGTPSTNPIRDLQSWPVPPGEMGKAASLSLWPLCV